MARRPRFLNTGQAAWYHIQCRTIGGENDFPLNVDDHRQHLLEMIKHYARTYSCQIAAFCIMGNHYHLVIHFDVYKEFTNKELSNRAQILYENSQTSLTYWDASKWKVFNERLFSISEFMRNMQANFTTWYNKKYNRRGRIWAERFKSLYLEGLKEVLDCILYIELNPVRAKVVTRPEEYGFSSANMRINKNDSWLMPLKNLITDPIADPLTDYHDRLYYRGNISVKKGQKAISGKIINDEIERGFEENGMYRQRLRYFVDGIALGSEAFIKKHIDQMRESGDFLRRKNPIKHMGGIHRTIRELRTHAR
jgi:putative transposase